MIKIGQIHNFIVIRENNSGYQLKSIECQHEVFMPPALAVRDLEEGQELKAFVYLDSTQAPIASEMLPHAIVGEYALMTVKDMHKFGAFMDWGISKDLLIPGNQQKVELKIGEEHLVRVCLEERTNRIYGSTKFGTFIKNSEFDFKERDEVKIVPVEKTKLGYRSIINKKFIGMIYSPEIFNEIIIGNEYDAVVKKIRIDGLVDVSLQALGMKKFGNTKDQIINMLEECGGFSSLNDKSSPDEIKTALQMSKQTFKKTIGILYRERKIQITKEGIELIIKKSQK